MLLDRELGAIAGSRLDGPREADLLTPDAGRSRGHRDRRRPPREGGLGPARRSPRSSISPAGSSSSTAAALMSLFDPDRSTRLAAWRACRHQGHRARRRRRHPPPRLETPVLSRRSGHLSGPGAPRLARPDRRLRRGPRLLVDHADDRGMPGMKTAANRLIELAHGMEQLGPSILPRGRAALRRLPAGSLLPEGGPRGVDD